MSDPKTQCGGSAASDLVVQFANSGAASLEDYKHKSNLPGLDDVKTVPVLYQTAGSVASKKKRSLKMKKPTGVKTGSKARRTKRGGKKMLKKSTKSKKSGLKKKKGTMKAKRRTGQRGAGFLNMAGCGPVNYPDAGRKYAHLFTKSSTCPGPDFYRNPPGLEKAGSGNGAVAGPGAPFPFK